MRLKDVLLFEATLPEKIVIVLTAVILAFVFVPREEQVVDNTPIIGQEFEDYPLIAWKDTQEKWNGKRGDIVKIKYRVFNRETFIQVVNNEGELVHIQPFERSPWDDGRPRDFTYTWMLYYTQDYGDEIPPGEYEIRVCHKYSRNIDLRTWITI